MKPSMKEILNRIEIAKRAVVNVRNRFEDKRYAHRYSRTRDIIVNSPENWVIGVVGVLEFVQTGDAGKVYLSAVRDEIKKILAEKSSDDGEKK